MTLAAFVIFTLLLLLYFLAAQRVVSI